MNRGCKPDYRRRLYTAVQEAQGSAHHYVRGYARALSEIRFRSRKEAMVLSKMGRHTIRSIVVQPDMEEPDLKEWHFMEGDSKTL